MAQRAERTLGQQRPSGHHRPMRAVLNDMWSVDVDVATHMPNDSAFDVFCEFEVTDDVDGLGGEIFHLQVTSPSWLEAHAEENGPRSTRHRVIASTWDANQIRGSLAHAVGAIEADNWHRLYREVERIGAGADMSAIGVAFTDASDALAHAQPGPGTPALLSITSPEVDIETWRPFDEAFAVPVHFTVGATAGDEAEATFSIVVVSPAWLQQLAELDGPVVGHGLFVATGWRPDELARSIELLVADSAGADWAEAVDKILTFAVEASQS
ncbi:MAG: Imm8 family immunity protein [Actinomycetota bacterium]